jgi:hypothetical protein
MKQRLMGLVTVKAEPIEGYICQALIGGKGRRHSFGDRGFEARKGRELGGMRRRERCGNWESGTGRERDVGTCWEMRESWGNLGTMEK